MDNAAFNNVEELERILQDLIDTTEVLWNGGSILDINGNTVGKVSHSK